jgi:hypothetical protein
MFASLLPSISSISCLYLTRTPVPIQKIKVQRIEDPSLFMADPSRSDLASLLVRSRPNKHAGQLLALPTRRKTVK